MRRSSDAKKSRLRCFSGFRKQLEINIKTNMKTIINFRKPLLALLIAASVGGITQSSLAVADVRIFLNDAPPALRYEAVPQPRRGYTWAPGYWDSNRGNIRGETVAGSVITPVNITSSRAGRNVTTAGNLSVGAGTEMTATVMVCRTIVTGSRIIPRATKQIWATG